MTTLKAHYHHLPEHYYLMESQQEAYAECLDELNDFEYDILLAKEDNNILKPSQDEQLTIVKHSFNKIELSDGSILKWEQTYSGYSMNKYFVWAEKGSIPDDIRKLNRKDTPFGLHIGLFDAPFGLFTNKINCDGKEGLEVVTYID